MKNFRFSFLILFLIASVPCFSQNLKNVNNQPVIQPLPTTRIVVLDNNGLAKNVLFSDAQSTISTPLQVQINNRATYTDLSNQDFQLRNDLLLKTDANARFQKTIVSTTSYTFGINADFNAKDINTIVTPNSMQDGWHNIKFLLADYVSTTFNSNAQMQVTGIPTSFYDPISNTFTTGFNFTFVGDETELLLQVKAGVLTAYYSVNRPAYDKLWIAKKANTTDVNQSLSTKADTALYWKIGGNWYQSGAERKLGLRTNLGRATNWNSLANLATRMSIGLNTDSTADFYHKLSFSSIGLNYSRAMLNFTTPLLAGSSPQSPRGFITFNMPTGAGALRMFVSTYNPTNPFEGNTSNTNGSYGFEITPNSSSGSATLDSSQYGNGSRLRFYYTRIGGLQPNGNVSSYRGIEFRDSLTHVSQSSNSANLDKGYIVADATLGKIAVRRYVTVANTVSPAPDFRFLAYEEDILVKSSLQTLQAGTNPTFDFEKSIQKTLSVTTVQAGDFVAATISNIKDGARYSIKFAAPFSTFLSFPSNVYKRDGTAFGTYTVMAEILDFVVIGTDLYCVNK